MSAHESHQQIRRPPSVSVVIPALNAEDSIGWVIASLPAQVTEVVLVDGRSVDGTELMALDRRGDIIVVHQRRPGRGAALRAGFAAATSDIIVVLNADGSTDPREIDAYVRALIDGADVVSGSRRRAGAGNPNAGPRSLAHLSAVVAANLFYAVGFTDIGFGYCAFWRRHLEVLGLTATGAEIDVQIVLSAVRAGLTVAEVASLELEDRPPLSPMSACTAGLRTFATILRERLRRPGRRVDATSDIMLVSALVPAHDSGSWLPAGCDDRTWSEQLGASRLMPVQLAIHPSERELLGTVRLESHPVTPLDS